jgi:predicted glycosyltransferase involved in capsule biosynthesis
LISLITTCKNRRQHLAKTLPTMVQQTNAEVIVVCYGCEQGTADWIRRDYPSVTLIEVNDDPVFCVARARNIGASYAKHPLLAFVDADIMLNGTIESWIKAVPTEQVYFAHTPGVWNFAGFVICSKTAFDEVQGFDEAFRGWGHEDTDFLERLDEAGYRRASVPDDFLTAIPHGNRERQVGPDSGGFATLFAALYLGEFYRRVKADMKRITGHALALEARINLMNGIKLAAQSALQNGNKELVLTCGLGPDHFGDCGLRADTDVVYRLSMEPLIKASPQSYQSSTTQAC